MVISYINTQRLLLSSCKLKFAVFSFYVIYTWRNLLSIRISSSNVSCLRWRRKVPFSIWCCSVLVIVAEQRTAPIQDRLGQAICGVILQSFRILPHTCTNINIHVVLGDCQLEGLIKAYLGQCPLSHFINTRVPCHTLVSIPGQSPSRILRNSHQFQNRSLVNGWNLN